VADLQTRLANSWQTCADAAAELEKLYALLGSARKRISWMVMNAPKETAGWAECSALVDEIDQALVITSADHFKRGG
jgi:hypothetical protein